MKLVQTLKKWFEATAIHGHHASAGIGEEPPPTQEKQRAKSRQKKKACPKEKRR